MAILASILGANHLTAADIEEVRSIPLHTFLYSDGGDTHYYKYGIYLGIGGGGPQLFEFDTGGEGLYAAYSDTASWWGTVDTKTTPISKSFGSGITYTGNVAEASLTFYKTSAGQTALTTGNTVVRVGKADQIEQTVDNETKILWVNQEGTAPVQEHFYGDFGLSLKKGSHGIENAFAQLSYGAGVTGGYKISLAHGPEGGAYVQVGLSQEDLNNPNTMWFQMQGQNTSDPFAGPDAFATYAAELLSANVTLTLGGEQYTFQNLGINLDSGNPTPGIDYQGGSPDATALAEFSTSDGGGLHLVDGTTMEIEAVPYLSTEALLVMMLQAGPVYGENYVYESERSDGKPTYLNIGALIFQHYDVTYNLETGYLGLTPIPEPSALALIAPAALTLGFLRRRKVI